MTEKEKREAKEKCVYCGTEPRSHGYLCESCYNEQNKKVCEYCGQDCGLEQGYGCDEAQAGGFNYAKV